MTEISEDDLTAMGLGSKKFTHNKNRAAWFLIDRAKYLRKVYRVHDMLGRVAWEAQFLPGHDNAAMEIEEIRANIVRRFIDWHDAECKRRGFKANVTAEEFVQATWKKEAKREDRLEDELLRRAGDLDTMLTALRARAA